MENMPYTFSKEQLALERKRYIETYQDLGRLLGNQTGQFLRAVGIAAQELNNRDIRETRHRGRFDWPKRSGRIWGDYLNNNFSEIYATFPWPRRGWPWAREPVRPAYRELRRALCEFMNANLALLEAAGGPDKFLQPFLPGKMDIEVGKLFEKMAREAATNGEEPVYDRRLPTARYPSGAGHTRLALAPDGGRDART